MQRRDLLRVTYAICLMAGASTHALTLWQHGLFWDYGGVPQLTRVYWTSLAFFDPLAVILLFVYPRLGLVSTLAIISTDVIHNLWFFVHYHMPLNWLVAAQCAFLIFVVVTFARAWRSTRRLPGGRMDIEAGARRDP